jgi:hypothetical protein
MAIRRFSTAEPGVKSNKFWDQDTQQGAMVPIGSINIVSNTQAQFLSFTNIPQTYQDLMLVLSMRGARAVSNINFHVTIASGQFFSGTTLYGDGATAASSRFSNGFDPTDGSVPAASGSAGVFGSAVTHILNYSNSSNFKTTLTRWASDVTGGGTTGLYANLVRVTSAVTSLNVYTDFADYWAAGTTVTLYGIKAGA